MFDFSVTADDRVILEESMRNLNDMPTYVAPDYPTLDGKQIVMGIGNEVIGFTPGTFVEDKEKVAGIAFPTLVQIGLYDALQAVEDVVAWNQTCKHSDEKWKKKTIGYHDAKGIGHLNSAQCGITDDTETLLPHRAHAVTRLLMALALELKQNYDGYLESNP